MSYPMNEIKDDVRSLANSAVDLWKSTSDETGKQMTEARVHAANVFDQGKEAIALIRKSVIRSTSAADSALHSKPYQGILIGVGVGLALGFAAACLRQPESD